MPTLLMSDMMRPVMVVAPIPLPIPRTDSVAVLHPILARFAPPMPASDCDYAELGMSQNRSQGCILREEKRREKRRKV
jgi:hypothetical protein